MKIKRTDGVTVYRQVGDRRFVVRLKVNPTMIIPTTEQKPRWTYSIYRASLRLDGCTVALLTPDGRGAFSEAQVQPLVELLNNQPNEATDKLGQLLRQGPRPTSASRPAVSHIIR